MPEPRIDLHAHSTASDGTDPPDELMRLARSAGLDVVALTDHDGFAGWQPAATAVPAGLTLLPGVELSAAAEEPGPRGPRQVSLHLLGYLVDPAHPGLEAACAAVRDSRRGRAQRMVQAMADDGHPVSWERTSGRAQGTVGRPHVAAELVAAGLVGSIDEAFGPDWIGPTGRYYVAERKIPVLEAIGLVRAAGGVAVFAHPGASGRGPVVGRQTIGAMRDAGLFGLEVDHPDHDPPTRRMLRELAAELDLVVTGSSDYHGSHKTTRLGQELTAPEVYQAIVAAATGCAPVRG